MTDTECERCGGTGYVVSERADGLSGAQRCVCYQKKQADLREQRALIPPNFAGATLENFQLPIDNPVSRQALSTVYMEVRRYAREFPVGEKPGLLLIGNPGTGKTHLAIAALKTLMARGFDGLFYDYQTLLERIQRGWDQAAGAEERQAYQQVIDAEILLLDDLGARRALEWAEDAIAAIITHRYNHRKPLIATSNLSDPAAGHEVVAGVTPSGYVRPGKTLGEVIGERARSRLFEMCRVVRMPSVEDYRLRKR